MFKTSLMLLFALLSIVPGSAAQQPDYNPMVVRVEDSNTYLRVDHTPVTVCPIAGYTEAWQDATAFAIEEISAVVPAVIGQDNCDVQLSFVARIPAQCGGTHVWGCTEMNYEPAGDQLRMVSTTYILQNRPEKEWLVLHELLHALGITGHSRNKADATYAYVQTQSSGLSNYDLAVLTYLYSQPAFR